MLAQQSGTHILFLTAFTKFYFRSSDVRIPDGLAKQGWIATIKTVAPLPTFTAASGPREKVDTNVPLQIFEFFFNGGFFKLLLSDAEPLAANARNTLVIDEQSMAGLIAVELGMGMVGLHRQRDYWANEQRTFGLFSFSFFRQFFPVMNLKRSNEE